MAANRHLSWQKYLTSTYILWLSLLAIPIICIKPQDVFCRCGKYAYDNEPFRTIWNSPSGGCMVNFSVPIELERYGILSEPEQKWDSKYVTVFYGAQLGLYPYYTADGKYEYNNGLPQLVDLPDHLEKAEADIKEKIPDQNYSGLAVIDWEPWRPLWERNWNAKKIYKIKSIELMRARHPDWPMAKLVDEAQSEFETAARTLFEETIKLGKKLRPKAYWGFYGFPDCFGQEKHHYQCTEEVKRNNDKLGWIFAKSTALFPSVYLMDNHPDNPDYVKGRLREAFRVSLRMAERLREKPRPVFVYFRDIYMNYPLQFRFLSQKDLWNTIGIAADMGAAGVVMWGNRNDENTSPHICQRINAYISSTLGPFARSIRQRVEECSTLRCHRNGYCIDRSLLNGVLNRLYRRHDITSSCAEPAHSVRKSVLANLAANSTNDTAQSTVLAITGTHGIQINGTEPIFVTRKHGDNLMKENSEEDVRLTSSLQMEPSPNNRSGTNATRGQHEQKSEVPLPSIPSIGIRKSHFHKHKGRTLLPHMYVLLIGVSIAGALLFSLIFVSLYYYLNMKQAPKVNENFKEHRQQTDPPKPQESLSASRSKPEKPRKQEKSRKKKTSRKEEAARWHAHRHWDIPESEESEIELDLASMRPVR